MEINMSSVYFIKISLAEKAVRYQNRIGLVVPE